MCILIAPDKFKGSLTAAEATAAIRAGLEEGCPHAVCLEIPIADGGEGTAEILCSLLGGKWISMPCQDPLGRIIEASYVWLPEDTAVIPMSAASGLARVKTSERDPLRSSTFGTGQLIADAIVRGASEIIIGLGGSATNDGGAGMAAALGYEFLDEVGTALKPIPAHLSKLTQIRCVPKDLASGLPKIIALCDVDNPLLGPHGATQVYGPQKGATPAMIEVIEAGLDRLADVTLRDLGTDHRDGLGAGAAGGMGFGVLSFCGGQLRPGFETIAKFIGLQAAINSCDLVITGEGSLDAQTLAGKGPAGVAAMAREAGKPVIAFAGIIPHQDACSDLFDAAISLVDLNTSPVVAMQNAAGLLRQRATDFARARLALFVPESKSV